MDLKPGDLRRPKFEVRQGFALFGSYNDQRKSDNPFHPDFNDNYARAEGHSEVEAVANLVKEINSTADSLWSV